MGAIYSAEKRRKHLRRLLRDASLQTDACLLLIEPFQNGAAVQVCGEQPAPQTAALLLMGLDAVLGELSDVDIKHVSPLFLPVIEKLAKAMGMPIPTGMHEGLLIFKNQAQNGE